MIHALYIYLIINAYFTGEYMGDDGARRSIKDIGIAKSIALILFGCASFLLIEFVHLIIKLVGIVYAWTGLANWIPLWRGKFDNLTPSEYRNMIKLKQQAEEQNSKRWARRAAWLDKHIVPKYPDWPTTYTKENYDEWDRIIEE